MSIESADNSSETSDFGTDSFSEGKSRVSSKNDSLRNKSGNGSSRSTASNDSMFKHLPDAVTEGMRINHDITVDHNVEKAMRVLKRKLIREGLFKELKQRKYYEKPCEKKKRKSKESLKRARKEEARARKFMSGLA